MDVQASDRAFLFEKEIKQNWSDILPLIQRIMNASRHQAIGCSPAQIIFGNSIDLDRHTVHAPSPTGEIELLPWHQNLVTMQEKLIIKVQKLFQKVADEHGKNNPKEDDKTKFPNGSFAVVKYLSGTNNRPPTKLDTPMRGPYRVAGMDNDHVQLQDILDLDMSSI